MSAAFNPVFQSATPAPTADTYQVTDMYETTEFIDNATARMYLENSQLGGAIPTAEEIRENPNRRPTLKSMQANTRPLSWRKIREYEQEMLDGEWELTHETIAITADGHVLDGQHRLIAVITAYMKNPNMEPVPFRVTHNADPKTFPKINQGKARSSADVFAIDGETKYSQLAASATLLFRYWNEGSDPTKWGGTSITPRILRKILKDNPELRDNIKDSIEVAKRSCLYPSSVVTARFLINNAWPEGLEQSEAFFRALRTGEGLEFGSPILAFREWALGQKTMRRYQTPGTASLNKGPLHMRLIIATWNKDCRKDTMERFSYKPNGLIQAAYAPITKAADRMAA